MFPENNILHAEYVHVHVLHVWVHVQQNSKITVLLGGFFEYLGYRILGQLTFSGSFLLCCGTAHALPMEM